jgi:hypothetical protein
MSGYRNKMAQPHACALESASSGLRGQHRGRRAAVLCAALRPPSRQHRSESVEPSLSLSRAARSLLQVRSAPRRPSRRRRSVVAGATWVSISSCWLEPGGVGLEKITPQKNQLTLETYGVKWILAKIPVRCTGRKNKNASVNHPRWHLFSMSSSTNITFSPNSKLTYARSWSDRLEVLKKSRMTCGGSGAPKQKEHDQSTKKLRTCTKRSRSIRIWVM